MSNVEKEPDGIFFHRWMVVLLAYIVLSALLQFYGYTLHGLLPMIARICALKFR